jgi:hypothetical protein
MPLVLAKEIRAAHPLLFSRLVMCAPLPHQLRSMLLRLLQAHRHSISLGIKVLAHHTHQFFRQLRVLSRQAIYLRRGRRQSLSCKSATSSAGSFAKASFRAEEVVPRSDSTYQLICWGGTLAVEMMRFVGSTSQRAMKRRWPGLVRSMSWKGETRCWLVVVLAIQTPSLAHVIHPESWMSSVHRVSYSPSVTSQPYLGRVGL